MRIPKLNYVVMKKGTSDDTLLLNYQIVHVLIAYKQSLSTHK